MRGPWSIIPPDDIEVVTPGGDVRSTVKGHFAGNMILVPDPDADIRRGDEMRRRLPNGLDEVFVVTEAALLKGKTVPPHYQVRFQAAGEMPHHQGGNFTVNISGPNARVNINSVDLSSNVVGSGDN